MKKLKKLRMRIKKLSPLSKLVLLTVVFWYLGYGIYLNLINFTWRNAFEWFAILCFLIWRVANSVLTLAAFADVEGLIPF